MKTLTDVLKAINNDDLEPLHDALPNIISSDDPEFDIPRLLKVASEALNMRLNLPADVPELNDKREMLVSIAGQCVERALWLSAFDPTDASWLT